MDLIRTRTVLRGELTTESQRTQSKEKTKQNKLICFFSVFSVTLWLTRLRGESQFDLAKRRENRIRIINQ
jgi:hypothetical protein